jgi:hypothetical protein
MSKVIATTTVTPARVMMFQASQRPRYLTDTFETPWGQCTIEGRLGQRHADFVDSLMHCATDKAIMDDGSIRLLVDPYKVRSTMSDDQYSHQQLKVLGKEVMQAVVTLETDAISVMGHIIDEIVETKMTKDNPFGGKRHLWNVRLGRVYCTLLQQDVKLYYNPKPIARLSSGVSQAIVRHILTHQSSPNGGFNLDDMIARVCGKKESKQMRDIRKGVRRDIEKFTDCGIIFDGDVFNKT